VTEEGHLGSTPPLVSPPDAPSTDPQSEPDSLPLDGLADAAPPELEPVFDLTDEFAPPPQDREEARAEGSAEEDDLPPSPEPEAPADRDFELDLTLVGMDDRSDDEGEPGRGASPTGSLDGGELAGVELDSAFRGEDASPAEPQSPPDPPVVPESAADAMDFSGVPGLESGLDLEPPLSEFTGQSPTHPMERDDAAENGEAMVFDPDASGPPEEEAPRGGLRSEERLGRRRPERPTPRNRPSPPRRVKRRSPTGLIVYAVVVVAVGAGGWFGWRWYQGRGAVGPAEGGSEAMSAVTLPEIPAELVPKMRELGDAALAGTVRRMGALADSLHLAAAPDSDWLAGVYMSNASRYGDVYDYWVGLRELVDTLRAEDAHLFHDAYRQRLDSASVTGNTARILLERADSGFAATRGDRRAAYSLMDDLVAAALGLHRLLTDNESEIEYDPAAGGVSRDPVLEAVPKTKELGTEMWSSVDHITAALDALGTLDKVTTERLTSALFDRIRRAGFE